VEQRKDDGKSGDAAENRAYFPKVHDVDGLMNALGRPTGHFSAVRVNFSTFFK
jgi:hypothetical protein